MRTFASLEIRFEYVLVGKLPNRRIIRRKIRSCDSGITGFAQTFTSVRCDGSVYGMITHRPISISCLDTADYDHQCGRRNAGCTGTITHDLKSIVNRMTKLSHLGRWIGPQTPKTVNNARDTRYDKNVACDKLDENRMKIVPSDFCRMESDGVGWN